MRNTLVLMLVFRVGHDAGPQVAETYTHSQQMCGLTCCLCPQVVFGKQWAPAWKWEAAVLPCFWALSGHGRDLYWTRQLQISSGSSALCRGLTRLTSCLTGPT